MRSVSQEGQDMRESSAWTLRSRIVERQLTVSCSLYRLQQYAPRSGNPNVRKARETPFKTVGQGFRTLALDGQPLASHLLDHTAGDGSYDSDDSRLSQRSSASGYLSGRTWSQSSESSTDFALAGASGANASGSFPEQLHIPARTESPATFHHALPPQSHQHQHPHPNTLPHPHPQSHPQAHAQHSVQFDRRFPSTTIVTQLDRSGRAYKLEDGEETPISRMVNSFTQREAQPGLMMQVDVREGPSHLPAAGADLPKAQAVVTSQHDKAHDPAQNMRPQVSHRSLPPLLTGVRMPGPGSASLRTAFQMPSALDLSGWLDEPVMPSPMYRFGPYSALKTGGPFNFSIPGVDLGQGATAGLPSSGPLPSSELTPPNGDQIAQAQLGVGRSTIPQQGPDSDFAGAQAPPSSTANHSAAQQIWQHGISGREELPETLARAAAAHFITYPTLMVLPEATSPVPPFMFRPWLASVRGDLPSSLAIARVVLAGYLVRLPSSLNAVWEAIAREMRTITANVDATTGSDDLTVWAATAALWLYLVLAILTEEPAGSIFIDDDLVNTSLRALSRLASSLCLRVKLAEANKNDFALQDSAQAFSRWGMLETMRRTLFATYALLVLQRFREGALQIQHQLAGCDLVMDIALPAKASLFDSSHVNEWRSKMQQHPAKEASILTLRDLCKSRRTSQAASADLLDFFGHLDEFTNVCLSVALGLDGQITI